MAQFGDCASIFQFGLGVNAIIPTLLFTFHQSRNTVVESFVKRITEPSSEFKLEHKEAENFAEYLVRNVIRSSWRLFISVAIMMFASLVVCFYGLVIAAVDKNKEIGDSWVWFIAVFTIVVSPLSAIVYEWVLRAMVNYMLRLFMDKVKWPNERIALLNDLHNLSIQTERDLKHFRTKMDEYRRNRRNREIDAWRRRISRAFDKMRHVARHPVKTLTDCLARKKAKKLLNDISAKH